MIRRRPAVVAAHVLAVAALMPAAGTAKDGEPGGSERVEVRTAGVCGGAADAELRLRTEDGEIELRFAVDHIRPRVVWRVAVVHERRVVWRGNVRSTASRQLEVERTLPDYPGADAVSVRAWAPSGLVCRAAALIREL